MLCDKTAKYRLYEITLQHDNNSEHAVVTTEDCTEAYTVTYSSGGVVTRCVDVISSVVVSVVVVESVVLRLSCDVVCAAVAVVVCDAADADVAEAEAVVDVTAVVVVDAELDTDADVVVDTSDDVDVVLPEV